MKKIHTHIITLCVMLIPYCISAQLITLTWSTNLHDIASKPNHDAISKASSGMLATDILSAVSLDQLENVITGEYKALTTMSNDFIEQKNVLTKFIYDDSLGYIKLKYPLIPKIGYENNNAFGNALKRTLFEKKLTKEKVNIENYVALDNPITEGERLFLILNAVENVIITTLENEGL